MGFNNAAYPAGWVTVSSAKHAHLFLDSDALTFTLSGSAAVAYDVRDYYGAVVRSGTVSGTTLTVAALPLGWYMLSLYQAGSDATYGNLIGKSMFSVLKADVRLVSPPAAGATVSANLRFENADHIVRGVALIGPHRNQIQDATQPDLSSSNAAGITNTQADRAFQRTWYEANPDSARPRPAFLQFPNGGYQTTAHTDGVTAAVAALYPDIGYFEGPTNEPDLNNTAVVSAAMQTFKAAVKAGNASAKVMGPNPVEVTGSGSGVTAFRKWLAAGGAAGIDAISFHGYNAVNGDIALGRRTMDAFKALLAEFGLGGAELWQTEWGQFAATYGVFHPRRQCRWWAMHRFVMDQYGVPKERDYWFYDTSHGFWSFPSMWKLGDGTVTPLVPMMRVYAQEVWGKAWAAKLDFGTVENDHYIGSRFTGSDGSATLALLGGGRTDGSIGLHVTGATSLQVVDCFGTVSTVACAASGVATVPVGLEPVYVRLPVGVTATVEQVAYGPDVATWGVFTGNGGTLTSDGAVNGALENSYYGGGAATEWRDDATLPATLTVNLAPYGAPARPRLIDRVVIHCPTPWQNQSTMLDYDLEYQDTGGTWHLIATATEPNVVVNAPTNQSQAGCLYDAYHSGRSIFAHTFPAVTARAVRVTARATTYGGEPTAAALAAGGQGDVQKLRIREVCVYSSDALVRRIVGLAH